MAARAFGAERDVELAGQPAPLRGTLSMPAGEGRVPGVLLVAGSGPTDRNGNQPGLLNDSFRHLAEGLAGCGVASLRTDKRGIAESADAGVEEGELTVETYVQDAVSWLEWLAAQPRISRIGAIGHSEGALVASMAAGRVPLSRLVLVAGAGRRAATILREQLAGLGMAPVLRTRAEETIEELERGETVDLPPKGLAALFRPSVQPYLISWFRLDPVAELARTRVPTLVVQGTTDLQVGVTDARLLAAARPGVTLEIVDGMNHVLREAPAERQANLATYTSPEVPLMPGLVERVCGFVSGGR